MADGGQCNPFVHMDANLALLKIFKVSCFITRAFHCWVLLFAALHSFQPPWPRLCSITTASKSITSSFWQTPFLRQVATFATLVAFSRSEHYATCNVNEARNCDNLVGAILCFRYLRKFQEPKKNLRNRSNVKI
eukprot:gnl/MRDRNA2_/MRDRNA2_227882_c0_seq1.p1 gnl/MRDRNA2_/MRDRNA2_227882_c0~~gnl/MRDRNA2_/MRDRNA2_227882_c0_seq1.p1  ORF type:complete len:134 (+),score=7.87 gnl/MRDRNA2_/MRDRNA2_227882_c0_seq1:54-455(+)